MARRLEPGIREELLGNPAQKHSIGAGHLAAHPQRVGGPNLGTGPRRRATSVHNVPGLRGKARRARKRR
jgi:hypothetical protein